MPDGDKHVSLAGLKAVYDHLDSNISDLRSAVKATDIGRHPLTLNYSAGVYSPTTGSGSSNNAITVGGETLSGRYGVRGAVGPYLKAVETASTIYPFLLGTNSGTYAGWWDGTGFVKTGFVAGPHTLDVESVMKAYPGYTFKMAFFDVEATSAVDVAETLEKITFIYQDRNLLGGLYLPDSNYGKPDIVAREFIDPATGINTTTSANKYARTVLFDPGKNIAVGISGSTYYFSVLEYGAGADITDGTGFIGRLEHWTDQVMILNNSTEKIVINIQRKDGANIASGNTEVTAIQDALVFYRITDDTLSKIGVPADAKAVTDAIGELGASVAEDIGEVGTVSRMILPGWEIGRVSSINRDSQSTDTTSIRTPIPVMKPIAPVINYSVPEGYKMTVVVTNNGEAKSYTENLTGTGTLSFDEGDRFRLALVSVTDGADVSPMVGYQVSLTAANTLSEYQPGVMSDYDAEFLVNFSIFEKFGVVGDSFASGSLHHPDDGGWTSNFQLSWPQILARKTGTNAVNYTKGGLNSATWLNSNLVEALAGENAEVQQLYIIALGINDYTQINKPNNPTMTLGSLSDIPQTHDASVGNSFYGCYGKIIRIIQHKAPNAKIVCLSVARFSERSMDEHIHAIADACGVCFIDLTSDPFFTSGNFSSAMIKNHPIAYGYAGMANAIERLICKNILTNRAYWATYYGLTGDDQSGDPDDGN